MTLPTHSSHTTNANVVGRQPPKCWCKPMIYLSICHQCTSHMLSMALGCLVPTQALVSKSVFTATCLQHRHGASLERNVTCLPWNAGPRALARWSSTDSCNIVAQPNISPQIVHFSTNHIDQESISDQQWFSPYLLTCNLWGGGGRGGNQLHGDNNLRRWSPPLDHILRNSVISHNTTAGRKDIFTYL